MISCKKMIFSDDNYGKVIKKQNLNLGKNIVNVNELSIGVYHIKFNFNEGLQIIKLVKN